MKKCKCGGPLSFWENEFEFSCLDCRWNAGLWADEILIESKMCRSKKDFEFKSCELEFRE